MRNYFNYFTEIEEHFARKRGKSLLVSPLDWCLIELWKENGIPLHVVLRGIERSFQSAQKTQKKPPRSLFYCHPAVMEAFEEYSRARVGSHEEADPGSSFSREGVLQHLEKLRRSLDPYRGEPFERAAHRLSALSAEIADRQQNDYEQLDHDLNEIEQVVVDALTARLQEEERKELSAQVKQETRVYRKRLSRDMAARLERSYLARQVRHTYGLPEFSLFALLGEK